MIPEITVKELKELINSKEEFLLLDVRNEFEAEVSKIPNSILIPLPELPQRIDELNKHKDKLIIVYCRSGARSARATEFLLSQGFKDVRNLGGGILAWNGLKN